MFMLTLLSGLRLARLGVQTSASAETALLVELSAIRYLSSMMASTSLPTAKGADDGLPKEVAVVFVLGGPASGKGTQSLRIAQHFGFTHLSAGDLLETEANSGSERGTMIRNFKKEGMIVPSEVTVNLLQQALEKSNNKKFIIDGFPRNEENRLAFENTLRIEPIFVLFLDCPEEELKRRILNRNQGRIDDNANTIPKRLKVYFESTMPVINYYHSKGKVVKVDGRRSVEEVFEDIKGVFSELEPGVSTPPPERKLF